MDGDPALRAAAGVCSHRKRLQREACLLIGEVTVGCEVFSSSRPGVLGFHVVPVNAEYNDCAICTTDGEEVRYEVDGYLGRGERGDFASLS